MCSLRLCGGFFPSWPCFVKEQVAYTPIYKLDDLQKKLQEAPELIKKGKLTMDLLRQDLNLDDVKEIELEQFISNFLLWALRINPTDAMSFLTNLLSLQQINRVVKCKVDSYGLQDIKFEKAVDWAAKRVRFLPKSVSPSLGSRIRLHWRKFRPLLICFIPTLLNLFIGAFNFIESSKKFTTLWEKHLILEIVYKFVQILLNLVKVLEPILVVPAKVYTVAALTFAGVGMGLYIYQNWVRPVPKTLVGCDSIDEIGIDSFVQQAVQLNDLENILSKLVLINSHVLVKGWSGVGKSSIMEHIIWLKEQGKLPAELMNKEFFFIKVGGISNSYTTSLREQIDEFKRQASGCFDKFVIIAEEIDVLTANADHLRTFQSDILDLKKYGLLIMATTTLKGYEKMESMDEAKAFRRRFEEYTLHVDDELVKVTLLHYIRRFARDVVLEKGIIEKIVEETRPDKGEILGHPTLASKLLDKAIEKYRKTYHPYFTPEGLLSERTQADLTLQKMEAEEPHGKKFAKLIQQEEVVSKLKNQIDVIKKQAKVLANYKAVEIDFKNQCGELARRSNKWTEEQEKLYLLYEFFAIKGAKNLFKKELIEFEKITKIRENEQVKKTLAVTRVDEELIKDLVKDQKALLVSSQKTSSPTKCRLTGVNGHA